MSKEDFDKLVQGLEKKFNTRIRRLGDEKITPLESISSGSLSLNNALGIGGYPRGRIIEIFGPESGGKSLLSLLAIAEAQKNDGKAVLIDAENSFDPIWAQKLGVNVADLYVAQPDVGESALDMVRGLIKTGEVDIVVVDSVTALVPKIEFEGNIEDQHMGLQARMMSQAMRILVSEIGKNKTVVLMINQLREKIGVMFGNPETTPGGRALKFYSSIRLRVDRLSGSDIKSDQGDAVGHRVKVKVVKNKCAPPFKVAEFPLYYETGVNPAEELFGVALDKGIILIKGHTYCYKEEKWVGQENAKRSILGSETLQKEILQDILNLKK